MHDLSNIVVVGDLECYLRSFVSFVFVNKQISFDVVLTKDFTLTFYGL